MIEVISSRKFIYSIRQWYFGESHVQTYVKGSGGIVSIEIRPGVSLEYQIGLANTLKLNAWFNIPHLADDNYIQNMAILIRDTLNSSLKAYIEYSNEVWNWAPGFIQTQYAYNMGTKTGYLDGNRHLTWYGKKVVSVQQIFYNVFGSEANSRIVRVLAVQPGTGDVQLNAAGGSFAVDALAIAPYFGSSLNAYFYNRGWINATVDDILDEARVSILHDTMMATRYSYLAANSSGVRLIAYEGGQHMGGGGSCGSVDCTSIYGLQALFIAANHDHRIKGLYRNMLKAWALEGGKEFASFSHIGFDSKYGSWGILQYQQDNRTTAWKYQALIENLGPIKDSNNSLSTATPSNLSSVYPSGRPSRRPSATMSKTPTKR